MKDLKMNETLDFNFSNSIQLSGLINFKPTYKETKRANGVVSLSAMFVLVQKEMTWQKNVKPIVFYCHTRSPKVIEELKKYDRQIYVSCLGKLTYIYDKTTRKPIYYPLIEEIAVEFVCPERMEIYETKHQE